MGPPRITHNGSLKAVPKTPHGIKKEQRCKDGTSK
jgi:hypothetical protein